MVEEFLSEEEEVVTRFGEFHLTQDRLIKLIEGNGDRDYKDIQLENIASFQHSKHFNKMLAVFGGLVAAFGAASTSGTSNLQIPMMITFLGLAAVIYAFVTSNKEYTIHSDAEVKMELPKSSKTRKFWKAVNHQKNHSS